MSTSAILIIALALALDAFAVALAAGVSLPSVNSRHLFRLAWHFGLFQAMMNIIGWTAGLSFRELIESFDHWVAFGLLILVGLRMIYEAIHGVDDQNKKADPTRGKTLVVLAVATSIDSLAVGLSFSLLKIEIIKPALIIGVVAALLTAVGLMLGRLLKTASRLGAKVEIAGGLVLIAIGIRILFDHKVF
ncbi:MAG: hypothetical protein A2511_10940 [Deltaproteobacteria bacterium RIFOXYD12_FULL_50_9]|nr:MAG: hypothetical protein A2511_10940 [Deltaproteobacteria bacterium RIFOXYD12_FULL_50_9]